MGPFNQFDKVSVDNGKRNPSVLERGIGHRLDDGFAASLVDFLQTALEMVNVEGDMD